MHAGHLLILRVLVIIFSLALVTLTFVHHHQKGQTTVFLISEIGLAILLAITSLAASFSW